MASLNKRRVQRPSKDKKAWSKEEDELLLSLVDQYGITMWSKVSEALRVRSGKQCRERYHNHLDPAVKKGSWSAEEDNLILSLQKKYGNAWAKITSYLPGRTDNAVKNRYWSATRSKARREKMGSNRCYSSDSHSSVVSLSSVVSDHLSDHGSDASSERGDSDSVSFVSSAPPTQNTSAVATTVPSFVPHSHSNLKVKIPTTIVAVDYMSDEEWSNSFLNWNKEPPVSASLLAAQVEPAQISPTSSTCSSDSGSSCSVDANDDEGLLDVAEFFNIDSDSFEFDMIEDIGGVAVNVY
jgi:hypothetical protein